MIHYRKILIATIILSGSNFPVYAQQGELPLSLSVNAGIESDSNLTVDAIDNTSNVGDEAFVLDASVGYEFIDDDKYGLSAGYNFYLNNHQDLDAFDMTIHGFNLDSRHTINSVDLGLTYIYNTIRLGGDSFMDINTFRPNIGYLTAGNKIYLIGAFEFQKQKFKQVNLMGRNATQKSGYLKAIYLMGDERTLTAGYTYSDHNTSQREYGYTGHTFDISTKLPMHVMNRETTIRAGYRIQSRGYNDESLLYDTEVRSDKRHTLSTSWQVPIKSGFSVKAEFEHLNSISTFAPVDYVENIWTLTVGWEY
ncbi:MAG: surface lipoprotein assembly modifier [Proteobacteria bacterium]|jgi:hypothetical protein|nr:surface lipoprotein assembly modifier [Pseudomonadota bacterium]